MKIFYKNPILYLLTIILIASCNDSNKSYNEVKDDEKDEKINEIEESVEVLELEVNNESKKNEYLDLMNEKEFSFERVGDCEDSFGDTEHKRMQVYIENKEKTEDQIIVEFKFIDACCQEFMGDYSIVDNTIIFEFEQVNDEMCECLCWYHHRLTLTNHNKLQEIEVKWKYSF